MAQTTTKEQVLRALLDAQECISGNELARRLGVSRSAVWKAIEQLRGEGYPVEAATNRGYWLAGGADILSVAEIEHYRRPGAIGTPIELHSQINSTNIRAKELAAQGAPHGTVVIAGQQTLGRGRFGRAFYSPEGSGVYISFILRPQLAADRAVLITSMSAVAVARAMEKVADVQASIKWVNDVYLGPKKACGILCEAGLDFESGQMQYVISGIGVNVGFMDFPDELADKATSISNVCGKRISRSRFTAELINEMNALYPQLEAGAFMEESRRRSNVIGREIEVLRGEERYPATAVDIDDAGSLVIRTSDGETRTLHSGEISVRFR